MKTNILIILLLISSLGYSATYRTGQSGDWSDANTWGGVGVPSGGDDLTINAGHTVTVTASGTVGVTGGAVNMTIYGVLHFANKATILLATGSTIVLDLASTNLTGSTGNAKIFVGSTEVWKSNSGLVNGQTAITETSSTLPIELISYLIKENVLHFTTASQFDVDRFEIELCNEEMVQIGTLYADPCNCNMLMEYTIPIENADVKYIRLVEYDYNGDIVKFKFLHINREVEINAFEEDIYYTMDGKALHTTYIQLKPGVYIYKGKKLVKTESNSY